MLGAVAALVLLAASYAVFFPAAWLRTELRGAERAEATFHTGRCVVGGCRVTFPFAGERVTARLPFGTRARGHADGDTVEVRHAPGDPRRLVLAEDTGRGTVAALLAVPGGATVLTLLAAAVHVRRDRRPEGSAEAF
ncbi:hypothetical protein CFC35_16605 [Streptomyces sp. FBKL.4005]|uniref:hypothetical protein n=1 Tax=Streptomyces sp. FBKL.4005 TaxID=2015515 RepID=UPI000B976ABC|nr:hypothetical protein [Streptomyces sp. FBKL.4005]OYP15926.1 hypothetical protein CFC35_16605 [Streptomyces sp. FBKL.4005]